MRPPIRLPRAGAARALAVVLALGAGLLGGGAVGFLAQGAPRPAIPPDPGGPVRLPETKPVAADTMLAWTVNGLPPGFADRVDLLPGVAHSAAVVSGVVWLTGTIEDGLTQRPPKGFAYPVEVAGATLEEYAPFLAPEERAFLADLAGGAAVLGETSARIRGVEAGGTSTLAFGRRRVGVAGIVSDTSIGANEVFVSRHTASGLGLRTERYLLVDPEPGTSRDRLAARIRALLPAGTLLRIRGPGETPYFRQGDAVLAQVRMKEIFGEFAARPVGGYLDIDPAWVSRHIVLARVPLLGQVRCNRALVPQLRGALSELQAAGLGQLVNPRQFGGCFSPRFINRNPRAGLSHHAWGAAVDINVAANPLGSPPTQDRRLVAIFTRWGFTWGGRFLIPDGMHFEFVRPSSGG